jgi:hypothetical protein
MAMISVFHSCNINCQTCTSFIIFTLTGQKIKVTLEQAKKARGERRGIALLFNLSTRWGWVVATPRLLYPWERDPVPIV